MSRFPSSTLADRIDDRIQGLEQAACTYGFLRSLNLTGAPIHGLVDCIAVNVFR
jgi:hypothetical protein